MMGSEVVADGGLTATLTLPRRSADSDRQNSGSACCRAHQLLPRLHSWRRTKLNSEA